MEVGGGVVDKDFHRYFFALTFYSITPYKLYSSYDTAAFFILETID